MADYYPLLVRAISGLAQNTGETRRVVFDRARAALLKQLRGVEPPLPEGEILRERQALEEAIRRITSEFAAQDASAAPADAPEPQPVAPPTEPTSTERSRREPTTGRTAAPKAEPAKPEADKAAAHKPEAVTSEPTKSGLAKSASIRTEAAAEADAPQAPVEKTAPAAEPASASDAGEEEGSSQRPVLARGKVAGRDARPRLPKERDGEKKRRGPRALLAGVLVVLVAGGGAAAYLKRDLLFTKSVPATAPTVASTVPANASEPAKSADRLSQAADSDAARRAAPAAPRVPSATQRAVLLEETPGAAQGLQSYEGTVTWKTETFNAGPGLPPDVGIRGDIQIPERRMGVSFTLRRNNDQALPASHTIEISFALPPDFAYGGISNVPGIRMKQTETAQGAPLAGLSVRVNPTFFLVGLSAVPADRQRNLQLLQTRPWVDVPIVYDNNKRAIIAFEKGSAGEQAFRDAFSAWGELVQAPPPMAPPPVPPGPAAN